MHLPHQQYYYYWINNIFLFSKLRKSKYVKLWLFSLFWSISLVRYSKQISSYFFYNYVRLRFKRCRQFKDKFFKHIWKCVKPNLKWVHLNDSKSFFKARRRLFKFKYRLRRITFKLYFSILKHKIKLHRFHIMFFKNWLILFFDELFYYIREDVVGHAVRFVFYLFKPFKRAFPGRVHKLKFDFFKHRALFVSKLKKKIIRSVRARNYFKSNKLITRYNDYNKYSLSLFFLSLYQMTYDQVRLIYLKLKDDFCLTTFSELFTLLNRKIDVFFKNFYSFSDFELENILRLKKVYFNRTPITNRDWFIRQYCIISYYSNIVSPSASYTFTNQYDSMNLFFNHKWYFFFFFLSFKRTYIFTHNRIINTIKVTFLRTILLPFLKSLKLGFLNNKLFLAFHKNVFQNIIYLYKPFSRYLIWKKHNSFFFFQALKSNVFFSVHFTKLIPYFFRIKNFFFLPLFSFFFRFQISKLKVICKLFYGLRRLKFYYRRAKRCGFKKFIYFFSTFIYWNCSKLFIFFFSNFRAWKKDFFFKNVFYSYLTNYVSCQKDIFFDELQSMNIFSWIIYTKQICSITKLESVVKVNTYSDIKNWILKRKYRRLIYKYDFKHMLQFYYSASKKFSYWIDKRDLRLFKFIFFFRLKTQKPLLSFVNPRYFFIPTKLDIDLFDYKYSLSRNEHKFFMHNFFLANQFKFSRFECLKFHNQSFIYRITSINKKQFNTFALNLNLKRVFKDNLHSYF